MSDLLAATVLLVEDDAPTRTEVAAFLRARGLRVTEADDARSALRSWEESRPDVLVLDLGLPDLDGLAVIRRVRREATTPILVLSARDRETSKIEALEIGADDYVTKPFSTGELLARLRALLRRAAGPAATAGGEVRLGSLRLDVARHEVAVGDRPIHLTPREFEVLKVLVSQAGRVVTHGRLLRAVWGTAYGEEAHYVHVYVSQIRRKLASADVDGSLARLITAEPGVGYRIRSPADVEAGPEPPPGAGERG
jgi:two-component system KDP operon response regulator KdpE